MRKLRPLRKSAATSRLNGKCKETTRSGGLPGLIHYLLTPPTVMNLTIPPESALLIGIGAFNAVRPIFVAFSILMLDWGERGPNRLRVFQSFNGKTLLRNAIRSVLLLVTTFHLAAAFNRIAIFEIDRSGCDVAMSHIITDSHRICATVRHVSRHRAS